MVSTVRRRSGSIVVLALLATLVVSPVMAAAPAYLLFGDAMLVSPGENSAHAVQTSASASAGTYGGVALTVPSVTTLSTLTTLSTDLDVTVGGCGTGSPRFSVIIQPAGGGAPVVIYFSLDTCTLDQWMPSGNLAAPTSLVRTSANAVLQTYAAVQALYGSYTVTDIILVTDASFAVPNTVLFDNTVVNATTFTYEPTVPTPTPTAAPRTTPTPTPTATSTPTSTPPPPPASTPTSTAGAGGPPAAAATGRIYGQVLVQGTNAPLAGVQVCLTDTPRCTTTDPAGTYQFAGLSLTSGYHGSATYGVAVTPPPGDQVVGEARPLVTATPGQGTQATLYVAPTGTPSTATSVSTASLGTETASATATAGTAASTAVTIAATGTGGITGTITDAATGRPLPGASVQLLDATGTVVGSATTDAGGAYAMTGLPTGCYTVRASAAGHATGTQTAVCPSAAQSARADLALPSRAAGVGQIPTQMPRTGGGGVLPALAGLGIAIAGLIVALRRAQRA